MRASWIIAVHHVRTVLGAGRGPWLITFWSLLVAVAAWAGGVTAMAERIDHEHTAVAGRAAFEAWVVAYGDDKWLPAYTVAENPIILERPPAPARALASGISEVTGRWMAPMGYHGRELEGRKADLAPLGALLGGLDLASLVTVAGALFALALGYDAVAAERERGTLSLHFVNGVGRGAFIAGKTLGAVGAVLLALVLPLALGTAALLATGAVPVAPDGLARAGFFLGASFAYMAGWAVLAVAISTIAASSAQAFLVLAAVWLIAALAWPRVAVAVVAQGHPVADPLAIEQALGLAINETRKEFRAQWADFRKAHQDADPVGADLARLRLGFYERHYDRVEAVLQPHHGSLAARAEALVGWASLSPAFGYQQLAAQIAGTDLARYEAFRMATQGYTRVLKNNAEQRIIDGKNGPPTWEDLPVLNDPEPPADDLLPPWLRWVMRMIAGMLLLAALAATAFDRQDLRAGR